MFITKPLMQLPQYVTHEGAHFVLTVVPCGNELRLGYALDWVEESSPHWVAWGESGGWANPFQNGALEAFLWLREGIQHDHDFLNAIGELRAFLEANGFLKIKTSTK